MKSQNNINKVKLIIMALVKCLPGITPGRVQSLAQETLFYDYFTVAGALSALLDQKLITVLEAKYEMRKDLKGKPLQSTYLTELGEAVYAQLQEQIPLTIREQIKKLMQEEESQANLEAYYQPNGNGGYTVYLSAKNKGANLLSITLELPDEKRSREFSNRWSKRAINIYTYLLTELNREDDSFDDSEEIHENKSGLTE